MTDQELAVPSVYTLTTITGRRRNDDRETIVMSFEMRRRTFLLTLLGVLPSSVIGMIAALFIGSYGLLVGAAALGAWSYLVLHQSRTGLRLTTWRALLDRRAAKRTLGQFVQCGQVVLAGPPEHVQVLQSMVLTTPSTEDDPAAPLMTAGTDTPTRPVTTRPGHRTAPARTTPDTYADL